MLELGDVMVIIDINDNLTILLNLTDHTIKTHVKSKNNLLK